MKDSLYVENVDTVLFTVDIVKEFAVVAVNMVTLSPEVIKLTCPFGPKVWIEKLDVGSKDWGFMNPLIEIEKFRLLMLTLKHPLMRILLVVLTIVQVAIGKLAAVRIRVPKVIAGGTEMVMKPLAGIGSIRVAVNMYEVVS